MGPLAAPVTSRNATQLPGQAVWAAIDRMSAAAGRVESALQPSFLRRLMGGVNRERCRAVVAASLEESAAVRRTLADTIPKARAMSDGLTTIASAGGDGASAAKAAASQAEALAGTCERMRDIVDRWRSTAIAHQDGVIGAHADLLGITKRIRALSREIKSPASGLGGPS